MASDTQVLYVTDGQISGRILFSNKISLNLFYESIRNLDGFWVYKQEPWDNSFDFSNQEMDFVEKILRLTNFNSKWYFKQKSMQIAKIK